MSAKAVRWAITAAAEDNSFSASYRASHSLMLLLLLLERASQLQPLKQPSLASTLARAANRTSSSSSSSLGSTAGSAAEKRLAEQIHHHQLDLLQQAEQIGQQAQQVYAVQSRQWLAEAEGEQEVHVSMQNEAIKAVKSLLQKLPKIKADLASQIDAAELAAVLAAWMKVRYAACDASVATC
jgi:hypothetical protein